VRDVLEGSVHEAQSCWLDVRRWPEWVDGVARIASVDSGWPQVGSRVVWESGPAGRGTVTETVRDYVPLERILLFVEDSLMEGEQSVSFEPVPAGVQVEVALEYRVKRRSPVTPLIEWLFVRRPMALSLSRTLVRFAAVLEASRGRGLG
jgi:polyketide cyclase/dehydrase/lipid transport protein